MNSDGKESKVLSVLTNSAPTYALSHPILKTHQVELDPSTTDGIFRTKCWVDCTEIVPMDRGKLLSAFIYDPAILVGKLPAEIMEKLKAIIVGSSIVAIEEQEKIA